MILRNVRTIDGQYTDIEIAKDKIRAIGKNIFATKSNAGEMVFQNAVVFPGFINSHDHLNFNLFPQLGCRTYTNYTGWGRHIHEEYKDEIAAVLNVPLALRTQWGLYKNLLAGVTTVLNHGGKLRIPDPLITVHQQTQNLHSVQFEKYWKLKLNNPLKKNQSCAIHTGEGVDASASSEIDKLIRWNFMKRDLIGVHGVAMSPEQAAHFKALVWCPASNYFLLNATADVENLSKRIPIVFGTDSTLTSHWNIWEHIRLAQTIMTDPFAIINMLTSTPAAVWNLNSGVLAENRDADIIIVKDKADTLPVKSFFKLNPEDILMVIHKGNIRLFDAHLYGSLTKWNTGLNKFSKISIGSEIKFVEGHLPGLLNEIRGFYPDAAFPVFLSRNQRQPC